MMYPRHCAGLMSGCTFRSAANTRPGIVPGRCSCRRSTSGSPTAQPRARVAALAGEVGLMLGLNDVELDELQQAAMLHDIGKIAIPDEILHKPGPLDDGEWEFVKRHTLVGERILGASPALQRVGRIVRASHERWDGAGYPDALAGNEIPLAARIVFACDAFAAMTADRTYREALSEADALANWNVARGHSSTRTSSRPREGCAYATRRPPLRPKFRPQDEMP